MHLFGCQLQLYRRQGHGLALVLHNTRKKSSQAVLGGPGRLQSLQCLSKLARLPPHTFVTNPEVVDVNELSSLLAATNQNCEMFPLLSAEGTLERRVDGVKLRRALRYSTVVTAVYMRRQGCKDHSLRRDWLAEAMEYACGTGWMEPFMSSERCLVGFGRATSDRSLTASIHDLAVAPSMQGLGIGKRIVMRIVRDLRRLGISDIAVLTTDDLRPFFHSCGFASDVLESTAMSYMPGKSSSTASSERRTDVGRITLHIP